MNRLSSLLLAALLGITTVATPQNDVKIEKNKPILASDLMTPEALWAMGRIASAQASPDGKTIVYQVGYYSVKANKGHQVIAIVDADGGNAKQLTQASANETDPVWIEGGKRIAYLTKQQIWTMNADGTDRRQITNDKTGIDAFLFSPDGTKVILIKSQPFHDIIKANPKDLPKATGRRVTDLMYRHWDHYVESIQHPWLAEVNANGVTEGIDLLAGEPYECPMEPFGGIEQLAWSPDSKHIAYTCRKKKGIDYSISTDSDIYLYDTEAKTTVNLCKPANYQAPARNPSHTLKDQTVNAEANLKNNPGYDTNPQFSPDGKYIAWQSMARDGDEADINRLSVYDLSQGTKT